jgi:long-chain acyl-CoA synthetase
MNRAQTLIGIFLDTVAAHQRPDLFVRRTPHGWEPLSAARARDDVERAAHALHGLGVAAGDRVALLSENRYEWPVVDLAAQSIGAILVPIYPTLTADQVRHMLADSEAAVVLLSTTLQREKIAAIADQLPALRHVVTIEPGDAPAGETDFAALLEQGERARQAAPDAYRAWVAAVDPAQVATIIYTSGTTGEPKGAMLTHSNIVSNVYSGLQVMPIGPADTCLSFLPLCHIFERMAGLYAMLAGGASIAYAQGIDTVAADAVEVRPTLLMGVPRFYEKVFARVMDSREKLSPLRRAIFDWGLAQGRARARVYFARRSPGPLLALTSGIADRLVASAIRARVGGRLRFCISGGAALSPQVLEFFFAVGIPVREGYGLTETSPVICLNPPGREKPGAVGPPMPGVELRIGDQGEIQTRGPHVMKGYFRNEAATCAAIQDGWFHTGDIGHIDDEGYLHITDRLKDLLVTAGGKKVAPQPIEARLKTAPWIGEAVLLGDGRPFIVCLLVPNLANLEAAAKERGWTHDGGTEWLQRPEVQALFQAEIDRINADLAPFEKIKRFTLLDRELSQEQGELTPTLKVRRRVISQRFASQIESLYTRAR